MDTNKLSSTGAVVAAIVASLCCIGPVVVALIGIGSIGAFAAFEAYRPYLVGVTVLLLGLAFYLAYRKREVMCEDGSCKIESAGKWNKLTVWLAAALAAVAIAFPSFDFTNANAAHVMLNQQRKQNATVVAVLEIEGMDCKGCAKGLEATLSRAAGVKNAAVEFEKSRAVVEYDSTKTSVQRLLAVVDETGFKAKPSEILK
jgi:copper chaperone CopZ